MILERKLNKLKKSPKLLEALSEKRGECLRTFLKEDESSLSGHRNRLPEEYDHDHEDFHLNEQCITDSDNVVQNLYRHLQPKQAVTIGETVHLIKHDQLAQPSDFSN